MSPSVSEQNKGGNFPETTTFQRYGMKLRRRVRSHTRPRWLTTLARTRLGQCFAGACVVLCPDTWRWRAGASQPSRSLIYDIRTVRVSALARLGYALLHLHTLELQVYIESSRLAPKAPSIQKATCVRACALVL